MHTPFCSLPRQGVTTGLGTNQGVTTGLGTNQDFMEPSHVYEFRARVGAQLAQYHENEVRALVGKAKQSPSKASKAKALASAAKNAKAAKAAKAKATKNAKAAKTAKAAEAKAKAATTKAKAAEATAISSRNTAKTNASNLQSQLTSAQQQAQQAASGGASGGGSSGGGDSGSGGGDGGSGDGGDGGGSYDYGNGAYGDSIDGSVNEAGGTSFDSGDPGLGYDPNQPNLSYDATDPTGYALNGTGLTDDGTDASSPEGSDDTSDDSSTDGSDDGTTDGTADASSSTDGSGAMVSGRLHTLHRSTGRVGAHNVLSQAWKADRPHLRHAVENFPSSWQADGLSNEQWLEYLNWGGPYQPTPPPIPASQSNPIDAAKDWASFLNSDQNQYPEFNPRSAGYDPGEHQTSNVLSQAWKASRPQLRAAVLAGAPPRWRNAGLTNAQWLKFLNYGGPYNPAPPPIGSGYGPETWADHLNGEPSTTDPNISHSDWHMGQASRAAYGASKLLQASNRAAARARAHANVALNADQAAQGALRQIRRAIRQADGTVVMQNVPMQALPAYGTVEFSNGQYPNAPLYDQTQDPTSAYYDVSQNPGTLGYGPVLTPDQGGSVNVDVYTQQWTPGATDTEVPVQATCPPGWTDMGDGINCADPTGQYGMPYAQAWSYYQSNGTEAFAPPGMTSSNFDDGSVDVTVDDDDNQGCPDGYFGDGSGNCVSNDDAGAVDQSASMDGNY